MLKMTNLWKGLNFPVGIVKGLRFISQWGLFLENGLLYHRTPCNNEDRIRQGDAGCLYSGEVSGGKKPGPDRIGTDGGACEGSWVGTASRDGVSAQRMKSRGGSTMSDWHNYESSNHRRHFRSDGFIYSRRFKKARTIASGIEPFPDAAYSKTRTSPSEPQENRQAKYSGT